MRLRRSFRSLPRAQAWSPFAPLGAPLALSWILLAYAAVAVIAGCAFAALRIHDDYLEVIQEERVSLRGAAAALTSATQAMLYDGVGAALAAAAAVRAAGGPHPGGRASARTTHGRRVREGVETAEQLE